MNKKESIPYEKIFDLYDNILASKTAFRKVRRSNNARKKIQARWNDQLSTLEDWEKFFNIIFQSDFLCGRTKSNIGKIFSYADFDWITHPQNCDKILYERYTRE